MRCRVRPLASRAIVLERVTVFEPVIEPELVDNAFQIVEPELPDKHRPATGTDGLLHFLGTILIEFNADRGGPLNDVEQLSKWNEEQRHYHQRLMRQSDERIHVAAEPQARGGQHQTRDAYRYQEHMRDKIEQESLHGDRTAIAQPAVDRDSTSGDDHNRR